MTARHLLIAGLGNIFLGDDGFGVAVLHRLLARPLPPGVRAVDFGIRALALADALERCDAAILVDAMPRGGAPGTLYVLSPELDAPADPDSHVEAHTLTPHRVLQALPPGTRPSIVRVVGCEPLTCELEPPDDGLFALSPPVQAALDEAVQLVETLVAQLLLPAGNHA